MSTMKGLVVTAFGKAEDVIKLSTDIPLPEFKEDSAQIMVQVYYASIHMGDWKVSSGDLGAMAGLMGFKPPFCPGQDYSGKVVKIGKNVQNFKIGDFVFGQIGLGKGTAAQYIIVTEDNQEIYKIPDTAPFSLLEASAMACSLETAYQSLYNYGPFESNESILILGGTTVIGMYAIQMAKNIFNANNITVTSSKEDLCKSLGADNVINYKEKQWEIELKDAKFDYILDVMGGVKSWDDCRTYNVLKPKGKYVTVAGDFKPNEAVTCCITCGVMCGVLNRKFWGCMGEQKYHMVNQVRSKDIEKCLQLAMDKKVKIAIDEDSPYKLENYLECYKKSMGRKAHGKTIIKLIDDEQINDEQNDKTNNSNDKEEDEQKYDTN
eukprot:951340_1